MTREEAKAKIIRYEYLHGKLLRARAFNKDGGEIIVTYGQDMFFPEEEKSQMYQHPGLDYAMIPMDVMSNYNDIQEFVVDKILEEYEEDDVAPVVTSSIVDDTVNLLTDDDTSEDVPSTNIDEGE